MSPSVSVILPVCNLQNRLSSRIYRILEVLAELSSDFEILIIDYGSTDLTADVASDLATSFPQVRMLDRTKVGDPLVAVEDGIRHTTGEFIFVHDAEMPFSQQSMRRLWQLRNHDEGGTVQANRTTANYSESHKPIDDGDSIHLVRRRTFEGVRPDRTHTGRPTAFERFTRTDLVQNSEPEESLSPNLAARLRRFVNHSPG